MPGKRPSRPHRRSKLRRRLLRPPQPSLRHTRTLPPPTPTPPPGHYTNPVFDRDFPDPDVLTVEEGGQVTYYAYATNSQGPDGPVIAELAHETVPGPAQNRQP